LTGVLFVCTGNICRSPTAEGVFRELVRQAGLAPRYTIGSAGTHGYHAGEPPDLRTQDAARQRGYDLSAIRARRFTPADFQRFDWVIGLDEIHRDLLLRAAGRQHGGKVRLLLEFGNHPDVRSVPDPYYGGDEGFAHVLDLIEDASRGLLAYLEGEGRGPDG
jgi:protein-tyrosine phosphatase